MRLLNMSALSYLMMFTMVSPVYPANQDQVHLASKTSKVDTNSFLSKSGQIDQGLVIFWTGYKKNHEQLRTSLVRSGIGNDSPEKEIRSIIVRRQQVSPSMVKLALVGPKDYRRNLKVGEAVGVIDTFRVEREFQNVLDLWKRYRRIALRSPHSEEITEKRNDIVRQVGKSAARELDLLLREEQKTVED